MVSKKQVIDPAPLIEKLAARCLETKGLECSVLGNVIDMIRAAPTVDAVEVVRCKDCKHAGSYKGYLTCPYCDDYSVEENHYCSYGGRKDDEHSM